MSGGKWKIKTSQTRQFGGLVGRSGGFVASFHFQLDFFLRLVFQGLCQISWQFLLMSMRTLVGKTSFPKFPGLKLSLSFFRMSSDEESKIQVLAKINKHSIRFEPYDEAWEGLPEFKGWLQKSANGPDKAYCKICKKEILGHKESITSHGKGKRHVLRLQEHDLSTDPDLIGTYILMISHKKSLYNNNFWSQGSQT